MDSVLSQLSEHGVWVVGLNVLLQQLGLPIPAVPTMMIAGALAAAGKMSGAGAFALSVAASLLADLAWFWAGRRYGYPVLRFLCRVSLSPDACVRQTEGIFERWGFYSVVLSKFVPGFATVAPPIAGALRMNVGSFALASLASAVLWVGAAMIVGFLFAPQIEFVLAWMSVNFGLAAAVVAGAIGAYVAVKAWQRWRMARVVNASVISIEQLHAALGAEPMPFVVDIGSRLAQQSRPHIPGAALLDLDMIAKADDFPFDRDIVLYCHCPNEASARRAAHILIGRGFARARPLVGGLDAWIAAGHPTEHGIPARFLPRASGHKARTAA
jgi:membrane protein DedA with SNARE-associated domain/rhodanese-related sulfurtransferase